MTRAKTSGGDRTAVVWTRANGSPRKLGLLVRTADEVRFSYAEDAADLPGISIIHDVPRLIGIPQVWHSTESNPLPPMLAALVPSRQGADDPPNLQRRILNRILEERGLDRDGDIDWQMLLLAGRNGIGHLDVFRHDQDAADFYAATRSIVPAPLEASPLWDLAYQAINATVEPVALDALIDIIGVRPTAGGAMPKLLLPVLPPDGGPPVDALVKFDDHAYEDLLLMEDVGYAVFGRLEKDVPRRWLVRSPEGRVVLATERFDRRGGVPVPMESLFSALFVATAGRLSERWSDRGTSPNFEMVGGFLQDARIAVTSDRNGDAATLYQRIVANVLIGNSDMHLENFGFLGGRGASRLSPAFDPAPMRGYESKRCVSMVSFGGLVTATKMLPNEVGEALIGLHRVFGLQQRVALDIVERCLDATSDFPEMIRASGAKDYVGERLLSQLEGTRLRIERAVRDLRTVSARRPERPH